MWTSPHKVRVGFPTTIQLSNEQIHVRFVILTWLCQQSAVLPFPGHHLKWNSGLLPTIRVERHVGIVSHFRLGSNDRVVMSNCQKTENAKQQITDHGLNL